MAKTKGKQPIDPERVYTMLAAELAFVIGGEEWDKLNDAKLDEISEVLEELEEALRDVARAAIRDNPKLAGIVKLQ